MNRPSTSSAILGNSSSKENDISKQFSNLDIESSNDESVDNSIASKEITIQDDLATFFHVKALKKHRSMKFGRHPSSLKKDSELYHYAKLSSNRKNRIQRGHSFWNVIEEESIHESIPKVENSTRKKSSSPNIIDKKNFNFIKTSSINKALSSYLSDAFNSDLQHLEMQVDFKNRNLIYYGMSCLIINYSQEILYVNKRDELRCKPLTQIDSSDRVKFKIIDLINPSNPKPLEYGDQIWLQVLDSTESSENTLQNGHLLTSKMFDLPEHSLINFDPDNKHHEENIEKKKNVSNRNITSSNSSPTAVTTTKEYLSDDDDDDDDDSIEVKNNNGVSSFDSSEQLQDNAEICGEVKLSRILEMRRGEHENKQLSDDQALRYTSRQALMVGRWMVHSAALEGRSKKTTHSSSLIHSHNDDEEATTTTVAGGGVTKTTDSERNKKPRSMHNIGNNAIGDESRLLNCVYSCSPIFVMQDLYCIGTKHASEHKKWPPRSTMIINNSSRIDKDKIDIYRNAYQDSAAVKTTLAQRMYNTGSSKLFDGDTELDDAVIADGLVTGGILLNKKSLAYSLSSTTTSDRPATTGDPSNPYQQQGGGSGQTKNIPLHDYGCLRKVVKRGFPYDFSVDRKCVWKLCLFEQFSDSHMKLSEKDKAAKKVMETATMMMKLSQLNREGARTHFHSHNNDPSLPPLKSGEQFSKNLREINFKVSQNLEEKYLQNRRLKESRLKDHFNRHIIEIKVMEDIDEGFILGSSSSYTPKANGMSGSRGSLMPHTPTNRLFSPLLKRSSIASMDSSVTGLTSSNYYHDNSSFEPLPNVPNLMEKPQIRRKNYLISTIPNSKPSVIDVFSIYSTDSMSKMDAAFTPKNGSIQAEIIPISRKDNSNTYNTNNINNNYNNSNLKSNSSKVFFPIKTERSNHTQNHQTKRNKISTPSQQVFQQSNPINIYDRLSEGEKVLAMHKSFHHINNNIISMQAQQTELTNSIFDNTNPAAGNNAMSQRQRKQQQMISQQQIRDTKKTITVTTPSIMNKLEKILEMDGHIKQVLHYKEQQEKLNNKEVFYGLETSGF